MLAYFERTRTKTIVNKREGRTEFNTKFEILYLDFSVDVANNFSASLCTDIRGRRYTGLRVPVMSSKIRRKCDLSTPFQLSEEKQTKIIYTIVYRNTINVSDFTDGLCKDISSPQKKKRKNGGVFSRLRMILLSVALFVIAHCGRPLYTKLLLHGQETTTAQLRSKRE